MGKKVVKAVEICESFKLVMKKTQPVPLLLLNSFD